MARPDSARIAAGIAAGAGVVLVLVVVGGGAAAGRPELSRASVLRGWPLVLLGVLVAVSIWLVVSAVRRMPRFEFVEDGRRRRGGLAGWLLVAVVIAVAGGGREGLVDALAPPDGSDAVSAAAATDGSRTAEPDVRLSPSVVGGAALVLATTVTLLVLAAGRRRRDDAQAAVPSTALSRSVGDARAALVAASDPRAAVIAAFAVFEASVDDPDLARHETETQAAWVERVLVARGAAHAPAARLRAGYERARYSPSAVHEADRAAALADLDQLLGPDTTRQEAPR